MARPKFWVGTSWKMNKTLAEAQAFSAGLIVTDSERDTNIQRFVIPPFTTAREVKNLLKSTSVKVGAQNMHWDDEGAWTGEVSPLMLKDCELDLVELGHSERRFHFGETDETVGLKTKAAVRHGLIPLICIGETREECEAGRADEVLKAQVQAALSLLEGKERDAELLLAYEPVWAIGVSGIPATAEYAARRHQQIANVAQNLLGRPVPILYGGSVNAGNCAELIAQDNIDGLFIGRAAWNVRGYLDILDRTSAVI